MKSINYNELFENKDLLPLTYQDLLSTKEWYNKRLAIIERDGNRCTKCNYGATGTYAHFDEKTKIYSYLTDDGSEQLTDILDSNGYVIKALVPNLIVTDKPYHLQVHHKYYILNYLPWEYFDDALITLCNWCHSDLHQRETIKIYENNDLGNPTELVPCDRCFGVGSFGEYSHVKGGVCFQCKGRRFTISLVNNNKSL